MKLTPAFIATLFLALSARAQSPVVQAHLQPSTHILVGQPVRLAVTVYVPNYFTGGVDLPELELENAIVLLSQDRPENSNTEINGIRYAGITQTYVIYPQQAGDFRVPPAAFTVPYTIAPPKSTAATAHLPALTFHADIPAAARNLDYFLPTTSLTIQQKWSAPLKNLRAGDSIQRTITVTATKMQAMLIPPLQLDAPDGLRIYPDEPEVIDQKTPRGDFIFGRRIQTANYFIQKEGVYTLPPLELMWWNISANHLMTAVLPAVHFTAAPGVGSVELPPEPEPLHVAQPRHVSPWVRYRLWVRFVGPWCIAFSVLLWMCWRYLPRIYRKLQPGRERRKHSEPTCFRHLERACRRNDAMQSYQWLLRWLTLTHPNLTVDEFLSKSGDAALSLETNRLGGFLFAEGEQSASWSGREIAHLLNRHRRLRSTQSTSRKYLPNLNPSISPKF